MRLKEIATVQVGQNFKHRLENIKESSAYAVQMKDLTDDNRLNSDELYGIEAENVRNKYLINKNDILFRSRGKTNTAVLIDQDISSTVVASPLFRIRVSGESVIPSYLCWYINHPSSQSYFTTMAKGTSVQMIDKRSIEDLSVSVPPIKVQRAIIDLDILSREEQRIMKELSYKRQFYMEVLLMQYACKEH